MWWAFQACVAPAPEPVAGPGCAPFSEGEPSVLEGEPLTIRVGCAGQSPFAAALVGGPAGAELDPATGELTWTPALDQAGRHALLVEFTRPGSAAERLELTVDVTDALGAPGNVPPDPATYLVEFGLPVVHLRPDAPLHQEDVTGLVWVDGQAHVAEMKIRGASSAGYPKPGTTIEVDDELDLRAWGMGRPNHLILVSTFDDNSYVRQKLCYDLWSAMADRAPAGRLTPRSAFVTVYLDGGYHGLFLALDRIDDRFLEDMGLDSDAPLYKAVNHDANFRATNADGNPKGSLHDGYEQTSGPDLGFADLDALVGFTASADPASFASGAGAWLDPAEFADWYLFVRFAAADDSGGKNAYLVADPSDGRFRYVPWDFNHAWGQDWRTLRVPVEAANDFRWANQTFALMQDDPATREALRARWDALRAGPFAADWLVGRLDAYDAAIARAAARDWSVWADAYAAYGGWSADRAGDLQDHAGERAYVRSWVAARAAWAEAAGRP